MNMRYIALVLLLILSCSSSKDILLIQDSSDSDEYKIKFEDIKVTYDDFLRIQVSSQSLELTQLFNVRETLNTSSIQSYQVNGY